MTEDKQAGVHVCAARQPICRGMLDVVLLKAI